MSQWLLGLAVQDKGILAAPDLHMHVPSFAAFSSWSGVSGHAIVQQDTSMLSETFIPRSNSQGDSQGLATLRIQSQVFWYVCEETLLSRGTTSACHCLEHHMTKGRSDLCIVKAMTLAS